MPFSVFLRLELRDTSYLTSRGERGLSEHGMRWLFLFLGHAELPDTSTAHNSLLPSPPACWGRGVGGEGAKSCNTSINCTLNQTANTCRVTQHFVTRHSEYSVTLLSQKAVAAFIVLAALVGLMVFPVDLNDQLQSHTTEVGGIGWNWVLATELLSSASAVAHDLPHHRRELVRSTPLIARKMDCLRVAPRTPRSLLHDCPHSQIYPSPVCKTGTQRGTIRATDARE